jgi:hypothetical protein
MPQNELFYVTAYSAAAAIYLVYAASIGWRRRALRRSRGKRSR